MKRKVIALITMLSLCMVLCVPGFAVELSGERFYQSGEAFQQDEFLSMEQLAEKYLTVTEYVDENGADVKEITNISGFRDKIISCDPEISDIELAKKLYQCIGETESVIESLPEDKLLEILEVYDSTQVTNYIRYSEDGGHIYLSKEETAKELANISKVTVQGKQFLEENADLVEEDMASSRGSIENISNDGYLKLTTSASKTVGPLPDRTYYLITAKAEWLKEPYFITQDVLAISSTATYDNSYNNYGHFRETCEESILGGGHVYTYNIHNTIYKNSGANNPDEIWFEYSSGVGGIALRFNMFKGEYHGSQAHNFEYSMEAFVRFRCSLYDNDAGVQAAYGHKQLGVGGISVSLLSGSVSFSFAGTMQDYYGETLSIYK